MSDIAVGRQTASNPFQAGAIALMLVLGIVGFIGLVVLGAYAPDMRSGHNGGGHALSNSAVGYSGIVELARATGRNPRIVRNEHEFGTENLLVVTPESPFIDVGPVTAARSVKPTLFVLPKWETRANPKHAGWVDWVGLQPVEMPIGVLAPNVHFTMKQYRTGGGLLVTNPGLPRAIQLHAPRPMQVITGLAKPRKRDDKKSAKVAKPQLRENPFEDEDDAASSQPPREHKLKPLITDGKGGIVLAQVDDGAFFVLSDPDLINNRGIADVRQAASMLALLDWMNSNPPDGIAFDVSLNGFGHSKSPLKLLFEPPFLPLTICVAVALLLAGVQAFGRFGPPRARERAIAFGKAALVDNSAALVRKAGRERIMGKRYAALIRERAASTFSIFAHRRDDELDIYLDRLKGERRFTDLAAAAEEAQDRATMLAAAQALYAWQKEKIG
jgi:hypothetical protein